MKSDAKAQKKKAKPKFVKLKKNPKTRSKKKDGIVSHENETVNLDKISKKKKDAISSHENEATSKEQPDDSKNKQKIDMERIHRDKIPKKDTVKESDAKFAVEENSITNDESKDSTKTAASKAPSSNRSAPSHAPLVAPPPKPVSNKKDTKKLDQALFISKLILLLRFCVISSRYVGRKSLHYLFVKMYPINGLVFNYSRSLHQP